MNPNLFPRRFNVRGTYTFRSRSLTKVDEGSRVDFGIERLLGGLFIDGRQKHNDRAYWCQCLSSELSVR
jgi:hypothetical protein